MKLTRDMAIFDDHLPIGVKLLGYALGFALTIAVHIGRMIRKLPFQTGDPIVERHHSLNDSTSYKLKL